MAGIIDSNIKTIPPKANFDHRRLSEEDNHLSLIVFAVSAKEMKELEYNLKQIHDIKYQKLNFMPAFLVTMPADNALLSELAQYHGVARVSLNPPGEEETLLTAQSILLESSDDYPNLSNWHAHGFYGQNQTVGLLDSGIAPEHPAFQGKMIHVRQEPDSQYDNYLNGVRTAHGTGVACIYAGIGSSSFLREKGIARDANTIELGLAGDVDLNDKNDTGIGLTYASLDWLLNRAPKKPDVINYSFGNGPSVCTDCPDWSGMAKVVDYVINHERILWVKSAGNKGWVDPSPHAPFNATLSIPADNYNGITVANMNHLLASFPQGTPRRMYHQITNSSSRGPTKLGRKKPDIAAPGNKTRTCAPDPGIYDYIHYSTSMDYHDGYRYMGGTSAATPHVGAAVLLLKSAGITDPMAIKALLINSADAWEDGDVPIQDPNQLEPGHHQVEGSAWNRTYGWGYLNMDTLYKERRNVIFSELSSDNPVKSFEMNLPVGGKVTLVHERRVGHNKEGQEWDLTPLTLEMYDKESHQLIASDDSQIDTVHQVANCHRFNGEPTCRADTKAETVIIKVSMATTKIDGSRKEPFVLSYSNR